MAGVQERPNGMRRGWFIDWTGKQTFMRTTDAKAKDVLQAAEAREHRERLIRDGHLPPPKASDAPRLFDEVCAEYLAWGKAKGGRRGHPWSAKHLQRRTAHLGFWKKRIGLVVLSDLSGCLPRFEAALRELQDAGKAGKTLNNRAEALTAFCDWCCERNYLDEDPLAVWTPHVATPKTTRRTLTAAQARALLASIDAGGHAYAERRRMGYALALTTGLRHGELRSLCVRHLDAERARLRLEAAWTKNRRDGWQPLPRALADALAAGTADTKPDMPLVFAAREASNALEADLERAGLSKWGPGGKVDFHALRHTYVTLLHAAGASFEETRLLARHAPRGLTDGAYLHVTEERLRELAEAVGAMVLPEMAAGVAAKTGTDDQIAHGEYAQGMPELISKGAAAHATYCRERGLEHSENTGQEGFKSLPAHTNQDLQSHKTSANYAQTTYEKHDSTNTAVVATENLSTNIKQAFHNDFYAHGMPADLAAVVTAWPSLPDAVRAGIVAMVQSIGPTR